MFNIKIRIGRSRTFKSFNSNNWENVLPYQWKLFLIKLNFEWVLPSLALRQGQKINKKGFVCSVNKDYNCLNNK